MSLIASMEKIEKDPHKSASLKHDAAYPYLLKAIDIVREYIKSRNHILYGGTAIDYALRLKGDKIYADDEFPDFDFFSPHHVETTRELLEILTAKLNASEEDGIRVYAYPAMFQRTLRISVGNNNWVADISYMPQAIYDNLPTITYDGLRAVHPRIQYSDLHSSMTFPYDNAPREVVSARWDKDLKRYNKLFAAYPVEASELDPNFDKTSTRMYESAEVSRELLTRSVLTGFAAYSMFYNMVAEWHPEAVAKFDWMPKPRPPKVDAHRIIFDVPCGYLECFSHNESIIGADGARKFAPFMDLFEPATLLSGKTLSQWSQRAAGPNGAMDTHRAQQAIVAYSSAMRLIGYKSININDSNTKVRVVTIHALLKHFIAGYDRLKYFNKPLYGHDAIPKLRLISADVCLRHYLACLELLNIATEKDETTSEVYKRGNEMFTPFIEPFGATNSSVADLIGMYLITNMIIKAQREVEEDDVLLPPRKIAVVPSGQSQPPAFPYDKCAVLIISGEEILI